MSLRFVAATETSLTVLLTADRSDLDLIAFMVDGVHSGEHTCGVALRIGIDVTESPLSLVEGLTENATLVRELIVGLRERGVDVTRPILAVIDETKALRRAVLDVFDRPVSQQGQLHKIRNVRDRLPEKLRRVIERRMCDAKNDAPFRAGGPGAAGDPRGALNRPPTPAPPPACANGSRRR